MQQMSSCIWNNYRCLLSELLQSLTITQKTLQNTAAFAPSRAVPGRWNGMGWAASHLLSVASVLKAGEGILLNKTKFVHSALSDPRPLQDDSWHKKSSWDSATSFLKGGGTFLILYLKIKVLNYFSVEKLNSILHHFGMYYILWDMWTSWPWPELTLK